MALTRAEIELLIKTRNESKQELTGLGTDLKNVGVAAGQTNKEMASLADTTDKKLKASGVAAGVVLGNLATATMRALTKEFGDSIRAANRLDAGLIGLASVAKAFNQDADAAKEAAKRLAADGLMPVGDAATGLKNLLAAGFGLSEAVTLMERFKDSAAFGRQGALEFGQAIVGATEGIKNGNSALVDNAGVTKNLSVILSEAGFKAQDLQRAQSDVNVRTAIFNGILKETNPQLGDAAKLLGTAAGEQAKFASQVTIAEQEIGKALQPALKGVLQILTPMVQFVGQNADSFIHLGTAVAALVGPLAAVKAATALGIPPMGDLLAGVLKLEAAFGKGMLTTMKFADGITIVPGRLTLLRGGLNGVAEAAGLTYDKLGLVGSTTAIAATFIAAWSVGKLIGEWTGWTKAIEDWASTANRAKLAGMAQANVNETLAKASQIAGRAVTDMAEALKIVTAQDSIRRAQWEKSTEAQLKRIDAELLLGRITVETANAQKLAIQSEQQAQEISKKRVALTDVMAAKEAQFKKEIEATGYTLAELVGLLKKDEEGFKAWAKQVGLSDETMNRLTDKVKDNTKATKANTKETERLKEIHDQLFGLDVIKKAEEYLAAIKGMEGVGKMTAKQQIELNELLHDADKAYKALGREAPEALKNVMQFTEATVMTTDMAKMSVMDLRTALNEMGGTAKSQLPELLAIPLKTTEYWDGAIKNVQKGVKRVPGFWTEIVPDVTRTLETINTAVSGSFAQMILGAKGFKDGFLDIWSSLKNGVKQILAELLNHFVTSFLKGLIGAMNGQQGAFGRVFAGILGGPSLGVGGGSGGTGGVGGILGGLFGGGGGGGGALPPGYQGPTQGGGGLGAAQVGGGLLALSGFMQLLHAQGGLQNALAGAQTGAGIGTMIAPGVGTAIGAGVGALAGWVKSLFGVDQAEKDARAVVQQFEGILASGLTTEQRLQAGGESWKETVIRVRDAYAKVGLSSEQALADVNALWASSRDGGQHTKEIVERIAANLERAAKAATDLGTATGDAADDMSTDLEETRDQLDRVSDSTEVIADRLGEAGDEGAEAGREIRDWMQRARDGLGALVRDLGNFHPSPIEVPYAYVPINEPPNGGNAPGGGEGIDTIGELPPPIEEAARSVATASRTPTQTTEAVAPGPSVNVVFNVYGTLDQEVVDRDVLPRLIETVSGNLRQTRTNLRTALGVV